MPTQRFCVPDPCVGVTCNPLPTGENTLCQNGTCVGVCTLASCPTGYVCNQTATDPTMACIMDNCIGFPDRCTATQFCVAGTCVDDPCAGVVCPDPGTFCSNGTCVSSCATVMCPAGQTCHLGTCMADPCANVHCSQFETCNPATGMCQQSMCLGVMCPGGEVCNPLTGTCGQDPCLGVTCPTGQTCQGGSCFDPGQFTPDAGPMDEHFVTATGGGGCSCRTNGSGAPSYGTLLLVGLVIGVLRRKSKKETR
jgi:MYXO-CTERM domain-containing protein